MNLNEKYLPSVDHLMLEIAKEFNSSRVLRDVATYWGFRSTVPGPGLSAASEFLHRRYLDYGIQAEIREYPADDRTEYLDGRKNPLAWTPRNARLEIVSPKEYAGVICSYEQEPLCLISNSTATPPEGVEFEVVILHSGAKEKDYSGLDIHGKVILTDAWPLQVDALARKHGAMGIISDSVTPPWLKNYPPVRQAADVPDLTMWGVLDGHHNRKPLWGFSLTPRQGTRLRQILREAKEPIKLRAFVEAELKEGVSEVVEAVIPGSDNNRGEIWLLAHSSEPGALDNASGCCASVEIARCLTKLVKQGRLPHPQSSIRFLHAVEVGGFLPLVTELLYQGKNGRLEQVKAAIAFDSVGQDFRKGGGSLRVFRSPEANPAFTDSLLGELVAKVSHIPNETFGADAYEPFFWQIDPHFPGNDNFLGDSFFDIPTPMLCNWPDKHYHSNLDTVDKLSTGSMGKACVAAATYLVFLAITDPESARWMADLTLRDYKKQIVAEPENADRLCLQGKDALQSMLRLGDIREIVDERIRSLEDFATREGNVANRRIEEETGMPEQINKDSWIKPKRWKFPPTKDLSSEGRARLRAMRKEHGQVEPLWALLNGRRSVRELSERSRLSEAVVSDFIAILLSENLVEAVPVPSEPGVRGAKAGVNHGEDVQIQIKTTATMGTDEKQEKDVLLKQVFGGGMESTVFASAEWVILIRVDGRMVTHVDLVERMIDVGGLRVRVGGIGGVATLAEFRNRGLAKLALTRAAHFMKHKLAVDFGFLFCDPRMVPYYEKLGWLVIDNPVTYDQPGKKVPLDGKAMVLPCRKTIWLPGDIDVNGYPW